jgi:hypothetical protein
MVRLRHDMICIVGGTQPKSHLGNTTFHTHHPANRFTYCHGQSPETAIECKHRKYDPLIGTCKQKKLGKSTHTQTINCKAQRTLHTNNQYQTHNDINAPKCHQISRIPNIKQHKTRSKTSTNDAAIITNPTPPAHPPTYYIVPIEPTFQKKGIKPMLHHDK